MPQKIEIPRMQRERKIRHEMQRQVIADVKTYAFDHGQGQRLRPAWSVPAEPRPGAQCVADEELQLGKLVYWKRAIENGRTHNDFAALVGSGQLVDMTLEFERTML